MKQKIRLNESQLKQIVMESVKRVLNEGIGDEYLDNFGKSVSRSKRFGNVKDLSSWSDEQFDSLNSTRKDMHKKGRGVKTKRSTETRDWLRKQTEKGNPIIKYKKNPDEWMRNYLDSLDESKIKKVIKESLKKVLKEETDISEIGDAFFNSEGEGWLYIIVTYMGEEPSERDFVILPAPYLDLNAYGDDVPITLGGNQQLRQISDEPVSREDYEMKRGLKTNEAVTRTSHKHLH